MHVLTYCRLRAKPFQRLFSLSKYSPIRPFSLRILLVSQFPVVFVESKDRIDCRRSPVFQNGQSIFNDCFWCFKWVRWKCAHVESYQKTKYRWRSHNYCSSAQREKNAQRKVWKNVGVKPYIFERCHESRDKFRDDHATSGLGHLDFWASWEVLSHSRDFPLGRKIIKSRKSRKFSLTRL